MKYLIILLLLPMAGCFLSNRCGKKSKSRDVEDIVIQFTDGPAAMVYKTRSNYDSLVPVLLSEDKTEIVSYPHPGDLFTDGELALPTPLNGGYLLDNRGISEHAAFLGLTYEEYAALDSVPPLSELYGLIIDKEPFTELCYCGSRYAFTDIREQLNRLIDADALRTKCKTLK